MKNSLVLKKIFQSIFVLATSLSTTHALAHEWTRIKIPGAKCGDGRDYEIYLDKKSESNWIFEFTPGGACWSASTCYGPKLRTWIFPLPELPTFSYFTADQNDEENNRPYFNDHSLVHFPYCTGDVFAGNHKANYLADIQTYHYGYRNILLSLNYLAENKYIKWSAVDDILLWGASAGAIGAFIHTSTFDTFLKPTAHKTIIADSPGLHFGNQFWNKFPDKMFSDFQNAFGKIHLKIERNDGLITEALPPVFEYLSSWNIGVLQGSKDIIMSELFGEISMKEHHKLVMGPKGLPAIAKNYKNVTTWILDSKMHTFLVLKKSALMKSDHVSALDFGFMTYSK